MLSPDREWFLYTLSDPRTSEVRYVGWTVDVERRLYLHIWHSTKRWEKSRHKASWIRQLTALSLSPVIEVIETGFGETWREAERRWIAHFRAKGCKLTNLTDGGDGTPGIVVKESTRRLISANSKRNVDAWKKGLAIATERNRGSKHTPEQNEKVAAANRGKKRSPEFCAEIARRSLGRKASSETRALLSAMRKGRKHTEETRKTFSAAQFERWRVARESLPPGQQAPWRGMKRTPEQARRITANRNPHLYKKIGEGRDERQGLLF